MKPLVKESVQQSDSRGPRQRRSEIVVVSGDDSFLIELGPVLGERYRTRPVDSAADIEAQSADGAPTLIVLDADAQPDPRSVVARIEAAHPQMPIVVVAATRDDSYWRAALTRGAIIALVGRGELSTDVFSGALARAESRVRASDTHSASASAGIRAGQHGPRTMVLAGIAVLVAVAALSGWFLWHKQAPVAVAAQTQVRGAVISATSKVQAAPAAAPRSVLELLSAARVAFQDQKMLLPRSDGEPRGDSALELYEQVLTQDPANGEALNGLQRLFSVAHARIQADLVAGKLDEAIRLRAAFKSVNVDPAALHDMDVAIATAKPKWLIARAKASIAAGDTAGAGQIITQLAPLDKAASADLRRALDARELDQQLGALATQARAAIQSGALLSPAADSARTRLLAMRQLSRTHTLTLAVQRELQAALLKQAQEQTSKQQFDAAQRLISAAADLGPNAEVTDARQQLQVDVEAGQRAAAAKAAAARAAADAASVAASKKVNAPTAASSSKAAVPAYIAARPSKPLHVIYPTAAADAGTQGRVVIEFMLQANGRALNATVVESTPKGVFDRAAIRAVSGGRFDTSELTAKKPQRARVALSFKPG